MSVNRYQPHILVLPEDDANRELANGFHLGVEQSHSRQMQVLPPAGGRSRVLDLFETEHVPDMNRRPNRFVVLLIDFDGTQTWLQGAMARIPRNLINRVFVLGSWTCPEDLTQAGLGSRETIGAKIAEDCRNGTSTIWSHQLLQHNANEVQRLRQQIVPILF